MKKPVKGSGDRKKKGRWARKKKKPRTVHAPAPDFGDFEGEEREDPNEILDLGYTRCKRAIYDWLTRD